MKLVAILFFTILLASCNCCAKKNNEYAGFKLNSYVKRVYDSTYRYPKSDLGLITYEIEISLINKGDSKSSFWTKKCSWQDNFIISKDAYHFVSSECNIDSPTVKSVAPGDSLVFRATVYTEMVNDSNKGDSIKIGILLIDTARALSSDDYLKIMKDKSLQPVVIWSNSIIF